MTREEIIAVAAAFIVITIMFTICTCILDAKIKKAFDLLEDNTTKPELKDKEEDDSEDWKEVYDLLGTIIDNAYVPNKYLISALDIARKHRRCNS